METRDNMYTYLPTAIFVGVAHKNVLKVVFNTSLNFADSNQWTSRLWEIWDEWLTT